MSVDLKRPDRTPAWNRSLAGVEVSVETDVDGEHWASVHASNVDALTDSHCRGLAEIFSEAAVEIQFRRAKAESKT